MTLVPRTLLVGLAMSALLLSGCSGAPSSPDAASRPAGQTSSKSATAALSSRLARPAVLTTSSAPAASVLATPPPLEASQLQLRAPLDPSSPLTVSQAQVSGTNGLGLRLRADPAGDVIEVLPEGDHVDVVGDEQVVDGQAWAPVRTAGGQIGWAAADFLADANSENTGPSAAARSSSPRVASAPSNPPAPAAPVERGPSAPAPARPARPQPPVRPAATVVARVAQPAAAKAGAQAQASAPASQAPASAPPVTLPPVSQMDPLLAPAYRELVSLPKIGTAYAELIEKSGVRLAVSGIPNAWAVYDRRSKVITVDSQTILEDPRAVAAVLAHELTHATQDARGLETCLDRELEAHKVGINIWESFWSNEIPPRRSRLEHELGEVLVTLREGGDPGLIAMLEPVYKGQCTGGH